MKHQHMNMATADQFLEALKPERPVLFYYPRKLSQTVGQFMHGFNGLVTFAVKANPDPMVLQQIYECGIGCFDVASPVEIDLVTGLGVNIGMHYNNPIRSDFENSYAVSKGVRSFSVDRMTELKKLIKTAPKGSEVSVRLKLGVSGAAYDFGSKFGANPDECIQLLKAVKQAELIPSMTFHPGTQCTSSNAWVEYIKACADISKNASVPLHRLNVGGGFPSNRGGSIIALASIFKTIHDAVAENFENPPKLVCEPGRAMVAEAFDLALCVKARSGQDLFLNDGIYGGLAEFSDVGACQRVRAVGGFKEPIENGEFNLFGPTCDSLDQIKQKMLLPKDIATGDYLIFSGMGAYVQCLSTRFNGYGDFQTVVLDDLTEI